MQRVSGDCNRLGIKETELNEMHTPKGEVRYLLAYGDDDFYRQFHLWFEEAVQDAFLLGLEPCSIECNDFVEEVLVDCETEEVDSGFPGGCWGFKKAYGTSCRQYYDEELKAQYRRLAQQLRIGQVNGATGERLIYVRTLNGCWSDDEIEDCRAREGLSVYEVEQRLEEECESFRRFKEIGVTVCWASDIPDGFLRSKPEPPIGFCNAEGRVLVAILRDLETNDYADWLARFLAQTEEICGETVVRTYERPALTYLGLELERLRDDVMLVWSASPKKDQRVTARQLAAHLQKLWDESLNDQDWL